jgi:DNA-directed RNA polymerase subunit F
MDSFEYSDSGTVYETKRKVEYLEKLVEIQGKQIDNLYQGLNALANALTLKGEK